VPLLSKALRLVLGVAWLAGCQAMAQAESGGRVNIVLSESAPAYREVAAAFSSALAKRYPVQIDLLDTLQDQDLIRMDSARELIVPVGVRAMRRLYGLHPAHAAILTLMAPRGAVESMSGRGDMAGRDSVVYIDQPFPRSLAFIRMLLPRAEHVGLILSGDRLGELAAYRQASAHAGMDLVIETVATPLDVAQAMQRLLPRVDVFLMLPDSKVVNENTVRLILLASYRQQIPVIGFSRGLTNAGAVAAVVSDPDAIGREGAALAKYWNPETGALPPSRYTSEFSLVFNRLVARSLGLIVPEDGRELGRWRKKMD